jgi:hypothetical protein
MAMLEVAYQIRDCADLLVSSQNSEPGEGWHYAGFLRPLTQQPHTFTPLLLAQKIISAFAELHSKHFSFYTQSIIDLACIDRIKKNIDNIVLRLEACNALRPDHIRQAVKKAQRLAVKFDSPDFLDLYSFYNQLLQATQPPLNGYTNIAYQEATQELHRLLHLGLRKTNNAIKSNVAGSTCRDAHGISIYLPHKTIHDSYLKTLFAQESNWLRFLKETVLS